MKFKVWIEKERLMTTIGLSLKTSGVLMVSDEELITKWFDPKQKRAEKIYGFFLQQLPILGSPIEPGLDKVELYVGDIITDGSNRGPMVIVPISPAGCRFLFSDQPDGMHIIGCPWEDVGRDVTIHGNFFQHSRILTNKSLLTACVEKFKLCIAEIV